MSEHDYEAHTTPPQRKLWEPVKPIDITPPYSPLIAIAAVAAAIVVSYFFPLGFAG